MKKVFLISITLIISFGLFAQNADYRSTVSANVGFSLVGALFEGIGSSTSENVDAYSLPAMQLNYDYGLNNWFSIGGAFSYQMMGIDVKGYSFEQDGTTKTEDYETKVSRLNVAARFLAHYANKGRFDLYSGLRLGYDIWSSSTTSSDPEYDAEYFGAGTFAFQVVIFGMRGYVTDNIGIGTEIAIGSPHLATIGATYRF